MTSQTKTHRPRTTRTEWARLWAAASPPVDSYLRHGAWYRVVERLPTARILDVRGSYVIVQNHLLETRDQRPYRFTVVSRPRDAENPARGSDEDLGHIYAVCPICSARLRLRGRPDMATCDSCRHRAEIAWWETG